MAIKVFLEYISKNLRNFSVATVGVVDVVAVVNDLSRLVF